MNAATPERWARLWRELELKGDGARVCGELHSHYSEPHRHYHTLNHVSDLLTQFDSVKSLARQADPVEFAIWFHDVVYDTHGGDNEEKSAALAKKRILQADGTCELARVVANLILATKAHDSVLHFDAPLLVDLDLSIFGQSQDLFDQYETQIRREYDWVPALIFKPKRAQILEQFLGRPRIFSTDHFFAKYEQRARTNLRRSIRRLRGL